MEASGDVSATHPVEALGADIDSLPTDLDAPLPASVHSTGSRPDLQFPVPANKHSVTITGPTVPVEELTPETGHSSDHSSSAADEGEVPDLDSTGQDQEELLEGDQELSAEQSYRETLRGVRSFMAWNDIDSASSSQDDNPFTGSRFSQTGKVSVKVPVDEWLCKKFEKLNITLQEGYLTRNSETAGLSKDQMIKPHKTLKWYGMHSDKKDFSRSKVYTWTSESGRLNSSFPRIAGRSLPSAPASRPVSQDTLRKWERAARDQTYMCNQAAAFSLCLTKVQENMMSLLKIIQGVTAKGKSSTKLHQATDELDFLVTFNRSITQAMARTMQDLSDGVFISVANLTLARRDSYLDFVKTGIKQDTLMSLRSAPLHTSALFPDHIISKAEEEIRHFEDKRTPGPSRKAPVITLIHRVGSPIQRTLNRNLLFWLGNRLDILATDLTGAKLLLSPSDLLRHRSSINDNYCVVTGAVKDLNSVPVTGKDCHCIRQNLKTRTLSPVYCKSCSFCRSVAAKERHKSRSSKGNKICEKCFLCKSLEFCKKYHKCPTCCTKSTCRGQITQELFHLYIVMLQVMFLLQVAAKERHKSRSSKGNKICEKCFLCKSLEFCKKYHKCPTCCTKSTCRGQITPVLGKMGSFRRQP